MSTYQKIKERFQIDPTKRKYEEWIEIFKSTFNFSVADIEKTFEILIDDEFMVVINHEVLILDNKNYAKGTIAIVRATFGFVENLAESFYVGADGFNGALDQDDVIVEITHGDKISAKVIDVVKHRRTHLLGTIKKDDDEKLVFSAYDQKVYQKIIIGKEKVPFKENDRLIGRIAQYGNPLTVDIESVLGQADEPGMDVLSVLFVNGIEPEFPQEVIKESQSVPEEVSEVDFKGRTDHRDQYVVTIDGEDAKDLDDAIYMESKANGYRLYVHIADVSHYVEQNSEIDKEAYHRTSSVYVVDRVVPMLPKILSNGVCSLNPNVDRLAMTVMMDIDFGGNVIDYHIYQSVIRSKQRLSYNQVNAMNDLGQAKEMVELMLEAASRLQYRRETAGSIDFDTYETKFLIDHQGKVLDVFRSETGLGEAMIEAFMVTTNECVAGHVKNLELPVMYRVHENPSKEKMQDLSHMVRILGYKMRGSLEQIRPKQLQELLNYFKDKEEHAIVSRLTLRSMSKARYSEEPLGHFGLALEDYTHFTSPIRRYPDLWLHQSIKKYIFESNFSDFDRDAAFAHEASGYISEKERSILDAERQVEKMKKAEYMQSKIGETYQGIVSGVSNYGIFVELPSTVEGLIPLRSIRDDFYQFNAVTQKLIGERTGRIISLGDKIKVKCMAVNMEEFVVDFKMMQSRKERPRGRRNQKSKRVS